MKNLFLYTFVMVLFCACSSTENKKEQSKSEVQASDISIEQTKSDEQTSSSELFFKHQAKIKEAMFFHIRGTNEGLDTYRRVKSEKITISENKFEYLLVTLPIEYVREYQNITKVLEASIYYSNKANISDDDSVMISGEIYIDSVYYSSAEKISQIKIRADGEYYNSYINQAPYDTPKRETRGDSYIEDLIVNVTTPKIYPKDQYYLKARIQKLTEADLQALSNDELAYLRNEIFARHGHSFKTDKMSSYFAKQDWYEPYVDDATSWLNETEKWNAQYIKTFEN